MLKQKTFRIPAKIVLNYFVPSAIKKRILEAHYFRIVSDFGLEKEKELFVCSKLIHEGDTVIDIGANIGIYTKFFSQFVGARGSVFSFEPVGNTFKIFDYITRRLGLNNVYREQAAISNENGIKRIYLPLESAGLPNIYKATLNERVGGLARKTEFVIAKTLDSFFGDYSSKITFIKYDIEGHERYAVEGARRIIKKFEPAMLIEVKCQPATLLTLIKPARYALFYLDGESLVAIKKGRPAKAENIFFLTQKHLHELERKGIIIN
jgi:FkbM family methyltransferase